MGLAVLVIAQGLPVVRGLADHVMVTRRGRAVETGTVRRVLEGPRGACTRALLAAGHDPEVRSARRPFTRP